MPPNDPELQRKQAAQREALQAINQSNRLPGGLPYQLPALIAIAPTAITAKLVRGHVSKDTLLVLLAAMFLIVQLLLGLAFRSFLKKHTATKWQLWIR